MSKKRLLVKEQAHQEKAFEYYASLGESRSYRKVAAEFGVAPSTVKLWGKSFGWMERIKTRDIRIAREVSNRALDDEISRRERSRSIVHLALVQLAKAIAEGDVKMTLADLDRMIRLEAYLCDEPESRQEIIVRDLSNKSDNELREIFRQELSTMKDLGMD